MSRSSFRKRIRLFLLVFWLVVIAWMGWNMQAHGVNGLTFETSDTVRVTREDHALVFKPSTDTSATALIFYPGALVDPDAYAPIARAVAEAGFPVHILHVPWRLAPLASQESTLFDRTLARMAEHPEREWVVGGHSRGGALAAEFAFRNADILSGLLLVGTSHPRERDLSGLRIPVTKISASNDGLASPAEVREFAGNLPSETTFITIEGGNHSQFGSYGWQLGAGSATIDRDEQQRQALAAIRRLLEWVSNG